MGATGQRGAQDIRCFYRVHHRQHLASLREQPADQLARRGGGRHRHHVARRDRQSGEGGSMMIRRVLLGTSLSVLLVGCATLGTTWIKTANDAIACAVAISTEV